MKKARLGIALVGFATVLSASWLALAHRTGNERRTAAQCADLGPNQRAQCLACVARPRPHHYHPGQANGWRCDPNDGTP